MTNDTPCHHAFDDGSTAAERCIALRQWRSAIYEALINWNDAPLDGKTPKDALRRLIRLEVQAALDPAVSKDAAALVAKARRAALEDAARIADNHAHGSDKKFRDTIRRAKAAGNTRCFDLAAACAAGMDHEAREISAAIRALMEKKDE